MAFSAAPASSAGSSAARASTMPLRVRRKLSTSS